MEKWKKGSTIAIYWGIAFAIFTVLVFIVITMIDGWTFDYSELRNWLPIALSVIMAIIFELSFLSLNLSRFYLYSEADWDMAAAMVVKTLDKDGIAYEYNESSFKRVPWRSETSINITVKESTIFFVEKTSGTDIVIQSDNTQKFMDIVDRSVQ